MPAGGEIRARQFYVGILGMREVEKPGELQSRGGCWFELDQCHVHVGVDPDFRAATKAHIAFTVAALDDLRGHLASAGHAVIEDESGLGVERFYSADPFGNRLEFVQAGRGFSDASNP